MGIYVPALHELQPLVGWARRTRGGAAPLVRGDKKKKSRAVVKEEKEVKEMKLEERRVQVTLPKFRVESDSEVKAGDPVLVDIFDGVAQVDVTGTSKGKGFAGVMKRHGFAGLDDFVSFMLARATPPESGMEAISIDEQFN